MIEQGIEIDKRKGKRRERTIVVQGTRCVDDVVIVEIEPEGVLLQRDLKRVLIRNEVEEVRSRS